MLFGLHCMETSFQSFLSIFFTFAFQNVKEKWILELKKSHKGKAKTDGGRKRGKLPPIILVGTQSDLREDAREAIQ